MPTNSTTPELPGDEALREIEARKAYPYQLGMLVALTEAERDALCQTVRAAWKENVRLLDLVRYCRHQLHEDGLITDAELAALVEVGPESARRLESYDALRDQLAQVEKLAGPCVSCGHSNYDAERKECAQRWMEGRYSVVCGCPCAKHNSLANAATRMRDACVEKVREVLRPYELEFRRKTNSATNIVDYAVMALESLTLDQMEKKQ